MNMLLAVGLLTGLYMVKFQKVADEDMQAVIGHVMADSPAAKAGIQDNDRIISIDGKKNPTWEDVAIKEIASAYRPMYLTIERGGRRFETSVTPTLADSLPDQVPGAYQEQRRQAHRDRIPARQPVARRHRAAGIHQRGWTGPLDDRRHPATEAPLHHYAPCLPRRPQGIGGDQ
jgi:membrane-associated protease RseP (regulator of RpoE activity)